VSAITTHVLDTARGRPAPGIAVRLDLLRGTSEWTKLSERATDVDGRVRDLVAPGAPLAPGIYRLVFHTRDYFEARGEQTFYPEVTIAFEVREPGQHYHVPLLLSPFGYSTYRGS
jgi:5-hydroxyisourate hydrolase